MGQDLTRTPAPAGTAAAEQPDELDRRLETLPREVGVLLITVGALGLALPGVVGAPALLTGGLLLWPRGFRSVDGWMRRRCPRLHEQGTRQILRFLDDLERRYPSR